jgi:16S rRNA (cytosine967-C5)-methyltransferase
LHSESQNKVNARVIALQAICSVVLTKQSLSDVDFPLDAPDLPFAKSLIFGTLRFYHQLNDIVTPRIHNPLEKKNLDLHCLLLLGTYQLLHSSTPTHAAINETVAVADSIDKDWAKGFINAILRGIDREREKILAKEHFSHPTWLNKKLKQDYPEHYQNILRENNKQAPMTLRVHPSIKREDYQQQLINAGIDSEPCPIAQQALILKNAVNVSQLPGFSEGSCYVQDASAQLAAQILKPQNGELILDACCAPGGKTTHLAELCVDAQIVAIDSDQSRLTRVVENIERSQLTNIIVKQGNANTKDWWDGQLFDKILLDAPCSATGVIRRHPDIKLLRKPRDIVRLCEIQSLILDNLWGCLKPGGVLLYATCSVLKSENERQIARFLERTNDAKHEVIDLGWGMGEVGKQQLPNREFDGFYYAKLTKL